MGEAAMPSNDQEFVVGENIAEHVGVRKDGAKHQRPSDDAPTVHRLRGEHVLAAEDGLSNQRPSDAVCNRVHC